jgi:hypothetical protein
MALHFTSTKTGASPEYKKYLVELPQKTDRYKDSDLLDFVLAPTDSSFVKLTRGDYISLTSTLYNPFFTGFVMNDPELEYLGKKNNVPTWGFRYQATADDYILSLKPVGVLPPFLNVSMGSILRTLAGILVPNTFDTGGVQDGPIVAQYVVDPTKKFLDVQQEFCDAANFTFYANTKKLFFIPQDTSAQVVTIDCTNKHFTPANLTIKPATNSVIVNDVTVLGDIEPQSYVHEYFVGTGLDATFPLISSVYGVDNTVFIDESFTNASLDPTVWSVHDFAQNYLQVSQGYLNIIGGDGAWGVSLQSLSPLPMDSRIRFTHGEWDFISGVGVIGGSWTQAPNAALTGCLYGLNVTATTINPISGGASDTTQTATIDNAKRYVIRTIVEFERNNRQEQSFSYIDQTGTAHTLGGGAAPDYSKWNTLITEVDPTTGGITNQWTFVNTLVMAGAADAYATYVPVLSNSLHATVTGITVSIPLNATLETASSVQFQNLSFDNWTSGTPDNWTNANSVFQEDTHAYTGFSLKMQCDAAGTSAIEQTASGLIQPNTAYTINVRLQRSIPSTTGQIRFYLTGTGVNTTGLAVLVSSLDTNYHIYTGTLTTGLSTIPADLVLRVDVTGGNASVAAVYVDDIAILTTWTAQLVGPNEVDSLDGLAPVATIVSGNTGSTTQSSYLGNGQYNPGQCQLVFFKDSITQTSNIPPINQLIRLSYRSAGPALGRAVSNDSINLEAISWGDDGRRSIVRTDLVPRPRTAAECEMAAAALVNESAFQHYEGTYSQFSTYFTAEPRGGAILKFSNSSALAANLQAEEINQVVTTMQSEHPIELFQHQISFGKPDHIRRLLAKFDSPDGAFVFQTSTVASSMNALPVDIKAVGVNFAPDVTKPELIGWDADFVYADAGQSLGTAGLFFEARYTDEGWGVENTKNLIARSSTSTIAVPRNLRGRVFFIRQANKGNLILWSEDLTQSNYSGGTVLNGTKLDPSHGLSTVSTVLLSAGGSFTGSVSGATGNSCWSFSINCTVGRSFTATYGSGSVTFKSTGYWQRITVPSTSGGGTVTLTSAATSSPQLTRFSVETGTLVETSYSKTTSAQYGPTSRYSAAMHVSFPAPDFASSPSDFSNSLIQPTY